jgi:hypothetical protein
MLLKADGKIILELWSPTRMSGGEIQLALAVRAIPAQPQEPLQARQRVFTGRLVRLNCGHISPVLGSSSLVSKPTFMRPHCVRALQFQQNVFNACLCTGARRFNGDSSVRTRVKKWQGRVAVRRFWVNLLESISSLGGNNPLRKLVYGAGKSNDKDIG